MRERQPHAAGWVPVQTPAALLSMPRLHGASAWMSGPVSVLSSLTEDLEHRASEAIREYRTSLTARDYGMGYAAGMRAAAEALRRKIRS